MGKHASGGAKRSYVSCAWTVVWDTLAPASRLATVAISVLAASQVGFAIAQITASTTAAETPVIGKAMRLQECRKVAANQEARIAHAAEELRACNQRHIATDAQHGFENCQAYVSGSAYCKPCQPLQDMVNRITEAKFKEVERCRDRAYALPVDRDWDPLQRRRAEREHADRQRIAEENRLQQMVEDAHRRKKEAVLAGAGPVPSTSSGSSASGASDGGPPTQTGAPSLPQSSVRETARVAAQPPSGDAAHYTPRPGYMWYRDPSSQSLREVSVAVLNGVPGDAEVGGTLRCTRHGLGVVLPSCEMRRRLKR